MYRPYRGPAESIRSRQSRGTARRGGTNVDPTDGHEHGMTYDDEYEEDRHSGWETRNAAPSDAPSYDEMTLARTEWAGDTMSASES